MKRLGYKGFTLIELLIVIVIIGILAGVVLQILNPARQQNRAKDGVTRASMNKVALSVGAVMSAYGQYPAGDQVVAELDNATPGAACVPTRCDFTINGTTFQYVTNAGGTTYTLYAEAKALPGYNSFAMEADGETLKCLAAPTTYTVTPAPGTPTCVSQI
jgi:prepilin-type N-terminal cleavage/methylation domain-containing protein